MHDILSRSSGKSKGCKDAELPLWFLVPTSVFSASVPTIGLSTATKRCSGSRDLFKCFEISDNISLTVQDRHIAAIEH